MHALARIVYKRAKIYRERRGRVLYVDGHKADNKVVGGGKGGQISYLPALC